jgi:tRNA(adenine34) deaminase
MKDAHFMTQALQQANAALDAGEFPVGCVLVADGRVLAKGRRQGTAGGAKGELDHAEMVALRRLEALGKPSAFGDMTLYCTLEPCLMCFGAILIAGIGRIVYAYEDVMGGGTRCDRQVLPPLYRHLPLELVAGVLRSESLALFQRYFSDSRYDYWQNSLLARYTLQQPKNAAH